MTSSRVALVFSLAAQLAACTHSPARGASSNDAAPIASAPVAPSAAAHSSSAAASDASTPATALAPDASTPAPAPAPATEAEVWFGGVDGRPVRAELSISPERIEGRWVYEGRGSPQGLKLESTRPPRKGSVELRESTNDGKPTGQLTLERSGATLTGTWRRRAQDKPATVVLARELRSKRGDDVVRARRIFFKHQFEGRKVGFLPEVDGPRAATMRPELTLKKLFGIDESMLDAVTALDFDVRYHDDRLLTLLLHQEWLGAYPSGHDDAVTFDWRTGKRVDRSALRAELQPELVRRLDERVRAAWRAKKHELRKQPDEPNTCGPSVVAGFMQGDGPAFTAAMLDALSADTDGLRFSFDYEFAHVVRACSPIVDLALPWPDARRFVDPAGPLAGY